MTPKELNENGDRLFSKRSLLMSAWQDLAMNFHPAKADFTTTWMLGREFASDLATSYPIIARRELGNSISQMLRPTAKPWFHVRTADVRVDGDVESRRWLEWAESTMRRAMYDKDTLFTRATKDVDHDYATFGQGVISIQIAYGMEGPHLLYRTWHLRDVAWADNEQGKIGQVYRKWKPTVRDLVRMFPRTVDDKVKRTAAKDPFVEVQCKHMVVESDMCDGKDYKTYPYVSIFYDCENGTVLEETPMWNLGYVIPRWESLQQSQYAYSPAAWIALPDARLVQAMTLTLLEAGEKMTNPPMIAVKEAIRSDVAIYAGGLTWVDSDYDERLGEVLRPLAQDKSGMPLGIEMQRDCRSLIADCFFLNKLKMPPRAAEMTAFEYGQRVQEYIRDALPIFEPMEDEYNGGICDMTFDILRRAGAFGSPDNMPRAIQNARFTFGFVSPLHDAIESEKSHKFQEMMALIGQAVALDPSSANVADVPVALRDALLGVGVPAEWERTPEEEAQLEAEQKAAQQTQQLLANIATAADAAKTTGAAAQNFQQATTPNRAVG